MLVSPDFGRLKSRRMNVTVTLPASAPDVGAGARAVVGRALQRRAAGQRAGDRLVPGGGLQPHQRGRRVLSGHGQRRRLDGRVTCDRSIAAWARPRPAAARVACRRLSVERDPRRKRRHDSESGAESMSCTRSQSVMCSPRMRNAARAVSPVPLPHSPSPGRSVSRNVAMKKPFARGLRPDQPGSARQRAVEEARLRAGLELDRRGAVRDEARESEEARRAAHVTAPQRVRPGAHDPDVGRVDLGRGLGRLLRGRGRGRRRRRGLGPLLRSALRRHAGAVVAAAAGRDAEGERGGQQGEPHANHHRPSGYARATTRGCPVQTGRDAAYLSRWPRSTGTSSPPRWASSPASPAPRSASGRAGATSARRSRERSRTSTASRTSRRRRSWASCSTAGCRTPTSGERSRAWGRSTATGR